MKRTLVAVTALATATLVAGCVSSDRSSSPDGSAAASACPFEVDESITTTARIAYQDIPNGDLLVKDSGILEACLPNAEITWSRFASGGDVVQAFGSGSADLGLLGSSPATKALSAPLNIDVQVVWIHDVIGAAESLVVRDPAITSVEQLAGKTIATPFASTAHYSLLAALDRAGITDQVTLVNLAPDATVAAWQSGEIDGTWIWEPTLSELTDGHVLLTSADTAAAGVPTFDLAGATRAFVDANPEFVAVWTRAQDWAVEQLLTNPDEASVALAVQLGISPEEVRPQLDGLTYLRASDQASDEYLGAAFADNLLSTAQFLLEQGQITAVSDPEVYRNGIYVDAARKVAQP
ncbi:ABC transporter substrate-binding protein [Rhodococcus sp. HM1]|uniref:taurine ABC transporter substrate-binding protein n=1 Tax=unclassified Rhodococcus (in: high G+C Gram-positive bacteria) TaxID=192944 RepID=UPI0018CD5101|nr:MULTISPECIES: ABC transporter substrate-binding protein [unclassified Rhodococcus (in: high G+C Gram-positive bacteria)]MBH0118817.1 ABC transporter substrate-binding protein [Rhodococcus sp. CX]MCK8674011.1 ABC transporter substrate-binding protein [Rhodococcus sp. HM1]